MCFSARVEQDLRELSKRFKAEVKWDKFEDLFARRTAGEDVKLSRALERNFLHPTSLAEKHTHAVIESYKKTLSERWESDIFTQRRRLGNAQETLAVKPTKRAVEDIRIATKKIQTLLDRLADLRRTEPGENDGRIFPLTYAPILVQGREGTVIMPMRYTCRLAGKPANYDHRFPGTYNARRDNLSGFWNGVYGRRHAVMVVNSFFENVPRHLYEHRDLGPGEEVENLVLHFNPKPANQMLVACLWDQWTGDNAPELYSFAAVTDDPPEEIAATGHQRCIIALREENLHEWLSPRDVSRDRLEMILSDKERPYYEHQLAA
jgi:putative SOS response-associated peptidase YedK